MSEGDSQAFTIIPNAGYSVATVTVDLVSQGSITSYTFTNVVSGHTISASFVDDIAPTGSITINSGSALTSSQTVTLDVTCSDAGSGCSQMEISNDNFLTSTIASFATSTAWTLAAVDGPKTVSVRFRDVAGNLSGAFTDAITLDTTAPAVIAITPAPNTPNVPINTAVVATHERDDE